MRLARLMEMRGDEPQPDKGVCSGEREDEDFMLDGRWRCRARRLSDGCVLSFVTRETSRTSF